MEEATWKVYVHINLMNGKRYVGITSKKPEHRWLKGYGYKYNKHFFGAVKKYGWDMFEHIVLVNFLSEQAAKEMECLLIAKWATNNPEHGYNQTTGGDGSPGFHPGEETRRKLSIARMRENLSEETLRRRSEGLRGRKFSDEHKRKIGQGNSKRISMFHRDGSFIRSFDSARDAEVELGISHSHISQCCHGHRMTAGGYMWKFEHAL